MTPAEIHALRFPLGEAQSIAFFAMGPDMPQDEERKQLLLVQSNLAKALRVVSERLAEIAESTR